ncbi:alpha/beta hydrolase [Alkalihalobacillus sp. MEB130]|uniref:alpha/beta fold hydrolase n=1 Tax=Alkalihalobacillus sp. MEB130 TaxID=2976704 RepID=UPI0028E051B2|nr:alpha/beta hydrolase [Alkalihalobacillus sp. MEB130]MDT8860477.1 alpha/beta hydrolase [Alkalihalobacillus sp. MEB130]
MPYLKTNESHFYYEVHGEGTPIVFFHPPVMGIETFVYQKALAGQYQLIFLDLTDSGRSSKRAPQTSVTDFAEIAHALVTQLALEPVIVCGYSNGGSVAQEFALLYPELTRGVIIISGFPEVSSFLLEKEFNLGIRAAKNELMNLFSFVLTKAHFRSKEEQRKMAFFIKQGDASTLKRIYEQGKHYVSTDRLKQIHVPVLLIYGKLDAIAPLYALTFYKELKDVDVVLVSGVAHQVPTKRPDQCNAIIDSWIKRKNLTKQMQNGPL